MTKQELLDQIDIKYKGEATAGNPLLNEQTIKTLHRICCQSEPSLQGGKYRITAALSCGSGHKPPRPEEIDHFMGHFINQMQTSELMFHPVEFAAIAYKRLLDISPFQSKNEETATLFMNLLLARKGYPVIPSPSIHTGEYEAAMAQARNMPFPDTNPLTVLIARLILVQGG